MTTTLSLFRCKATQPCPSTGGNMYLSVTKTTLTAAFVSHGGGMRVRDARGSAFLQAPDPGHDNTVRVLHAVNQHITVFSTIRTHHSLLVRFRHGSQRVGHPRLELILEDESLKVLLVVPTAVLSTYHTLWSSRGASFARRRVAPAAAAALVAATATPSVLSGALPTPVVTTSLPSAPLALVPVSASPTLHFPTSPTHTSTAVPTISART
mmetsp:Transcript_16944/g.45962  ORF Transcript_16944/g.45962 Transcript_16944/m.45962 type:complete len:210 (+) Transcript_16944:20-649(+)